MRITIFGTKELYQTCVIISVYFFQHEKSHSHYEIKEIQHSTLQIDSTKKKAYGVRETRKYQRATTKQFLALTRAPSTTGEQQHAPRVKNAQRKSRQKPGQYRDHH